MSVSKPGNPNDITEVTASDPGNPTSLTGVANQVLPRSIQPYINFDFANNVYEVNNQGTSLADALTYSRASSATFVDRYIDENNEYQYFLNTDFVGTTTNNFTYSEDLQNSDWIKSGLTLASNADLNPLKTARNAFLMQSGGVGSTRLAYDATVATNTDYNISAYMKAGTNDWVAVYAEDGIGGNTFAYFNIKEGYIGSLTSAGGIALREPKIQFIADGWYRISVATTTNTDTTWQFRFYFSGGNLSLTTASDDTMYIWGLQLTQSVKPEPYVQTFNVAASKTFSATPRLEYDAATGESLGYLAERAITNSAIRNEEFDNANWTKTSLTVTANDTIAPDLTKSADKITETTATTDHIAFQSVSVTSGSTYTMSVFAKAAERNFIQLTFGTGGFGSSQYANFNLVSGEITFQTGGTARIVDAGNGWYRCSFTATATATISTPLAFLIVTTGTSVRSEAYTGDGTSGLYIWGAQHEPSPYATSYIRTFGATSRSGDNLYLINLSFDRLTAFVEGNHFGSTADLTTLRRLIEFNDNTANERIILYNYADSFGGFFAGGSGATQALISSGVVVTDSSFNKSAVTFDTNDVKLYLNGAQVGSDTSAIVPSITELDIGHGRFITQLDGHIKKVMVYNFILTADEVSKL